MSRSHSNAVMLFARNPVPGKVKTRLQSGYDADTVCHLYEAFLEDARLQLTALDDSDAFVSIHSREGREYFDRFQDSGFRVVCQEGDDLGQRMRHAFTSRFKEGYERVVIIGSDSPTLPTEYLRKALATETDMVLGPSTDGGYYLIGMTRKVTEVFDGVEWGGERVLASTLEKIKQSGASLLLLEPWYDIDEPEDLQFLKTHLGLMAQAGLEGGAATRKAIRELNL